MITTESKTIAVLSHITIIGWAIALVMNSNSKTEFSSFYIRQTLVLNIVLNLTLTSFIGRIVGLLALVFLVLSVINALGGTKKLVPLVGEKFQDWFKAL